jgi:3-oxoacyl-[acyl-carrier protein] reductase
MWHPASEALPNIDATVAEQAIHLFDRVLGHQAACLRQGLANHRDGQRSPGHDAQRGRGERVHALCVEAVAVQAVNERADVAVITGASGAIGSASAQRLAQAGAKVLVGYNTKPDQADAVVKSLPGSGHRTIRIPMLETSLIREAAAFVENEYGRCDVLVNSAGFTRMIPHSDLEALDDDLIDAIFAANVRGPFATIRAFAPLMKRSGDAVIVNISSVAAIVGTGSNIAYGGSKAVLDTMALSLARVLGPEIRVLTVSPAAVDTAFVPGRTTAMVEKVASTTPLKRVVQADEVAQAVMAAVVHLTSTTGWIIPVDGGKLVG